MAASATPFEFDPATGSPVGLPVDTTPAGRPEPVVLHGGFGRLEKLAPHHADDLWAAVNGHDSIWLYMAYGPFADARSFRAWIAERAPFTDPYSYAIVTAEGRAIGIVALMEIRPATRVVEIGHVLYSPALQRTSLATEAQYLMARYVFETLRYRRYEWKCNWLNAGSRAAAPRFGFTFEGIFRSHTITKGRNRDTAWFSIIEEEWPARKAAFERWLSPDNFDADGRQKTSLSKLMGLREAPTAEAERS